MSNLPYNPDTSSNRWITESNPVVQTAVVVAMLVVGLFMVVVCREFEGPGITQSRAGFMLGLLLLITALGTLLFGGKQVICVDSKSRRILISHFNRFRTRNTEIKFSEITGLYVGEQGDQDGGSIRYFVTLKLKTGKEVALFFGFFDGALNKHEMELRCQRLAEYLRSNC